MRVAIRITQITVALLFIISGLVKANDPLGLAYKMEEFFELWIADLSTGNFFAKGFLTSVIKFLNQHNLLLSVTMITLEIVAGVALLMGGMKKLLLWLLLALIIFFTFLTGYAYLSGKFTNCGCFGDCLPITPLTSFAKDIALAVLIVFLMTGQKHIQPVFSKTIRSITVMASLVASLLLQWYVLKNLPLVDCLPMKKGNNIAEQIKPPKDAVPSVYETRLVYQNSKTGELRDMSQDDFNNSKIWEDTNWKWKETKTKLVRQGTDIPKLTNFVLSTLSGYDTTEAILNDTGYVVLYFVNTDKQLKGIDDDLISAATAKQIPVHFVTTDPISFENRQGKSVLTCDGTVFRIAARVNPTIYLIKKATIINKWALTEADDAIETINKLK